MSNAAAALARRRWRQRTHKKICPFCAREFLGDAHQVYCTPAHQNAAAAQRHRERERLRRPPQGGSAETDDPPRTATDLYPDEDEGEEGAS